jgi:hypothetical protein
VVAAAKVTSWCGTCTAINVRPASPAVETASPAATVEAASASPSVKSAAPSAAVPASPMLSEGRTRRADECDGQKRREQNL